MASVRRAGERHADWDLAFGDDGSDVPGEPIVREVLGIQFGRATCVSTGRTVEDKLANGLTLGSYANDAMRRSDAGAAILLCDDDELHPDYLKNLSEFLEARRDVAYCYSRASIFNPLVPSSRDALNLDHKYNRWSEPVDPVRNLDASQVAWRLECCTRHGAWLPESTRGEGAAWAADADRLFFERLRDRCGLCVPTGFVGQYKGVHDYQFVWNKRGGEQGFRDYCKLLREQAGVTI